MRRRLSTIALFLAWLCANGAAWDAVQVVAWGRMFATYASYLPMAAALEKTFDGSKPCELCSIAQQGRDETNRQSTAAALGGGDRLVLTCEAATPLVIAAPDFAWPEVEGATGPTRTETVPVPPPRV